MDRGYTDHVQRCSFHLQGGDRMTIHKVRIELTFKNDEDYFKFCDEVGCIEDDTEILRVPANVIRMIGDVRE